MKCIKVRKKKGIINIMMNNGKKNMTSYGDKKGKGGNNFVTI